MRLLYDEQHIREEPMTYIDAEGDTQEGVNCFYLRVRLFKDTISEKDIHCPLYFLHLQHEDYVGDPEVAAARARFRDKKRTFLSGPDSKRIRDAVAAIDAFGGARAFSSQ